MDGSQISDPGRGPILAPQAMRVLREYERGVIFRLGKLLSAKGPGQKLQEIIDRQTEPWGVKATAVEVKDVALAGSMKRAMANKPKPSVSGVRRSLTPKANFKRPRKWCKPPP